tara:strand:+ start:40 stop:381 length:342 start_codon:yes stop_codon:yes gene_type:complete
MKTLKQLKEHIQGFLEILFSETNIYQYSIKNVELKLKDGKYINLIKYILIGSRRIQQDSASNLLARHISRKFNDIDSEIIITINTATTLLNCTSKDEMINKINGYVKNIQEQN